MCQENANKQIDLIPQLTSIHLRFQTYTCILYDVTIFVIVLTVLICKK